MKLLLVAATKQELAGLFGHYNLPSEDFVQTAKFDVLITGVGMTATAFSLGKHLGQAYNMVLNVGIAGSFDINLPLGSLVSIYSDAFAELGAEDHDKFIDLTRLGFGINTYITSKRLTSLPEVKGITVNKVHGNAQSIADVLTHFDAHVESMEGAAVFYACEKSNIPCLQVRSISNYVEPRNKTKWNVALAIKNLNNWLIKYLDEEINLDN